MGTAQGDSRNLFERRHPLLPLAPQILSNSLGIHTYDAGKEGSIYQGSSGFRCVLHSPRGVTPEKVVPFLERWPMNQAGDGVNTLLRTFRDQHCAL